MDTAALIATGVYGGVDNKFENKPASYSFTIDVPLTKEQIKAIRYAKEHGGKIKIKVRFH